MLNLLDLSHTQVFDAGCAALASALDNGALLALKFPCLDGVPARGAARRLVSTATHCSSTFGAAQAVVQEALAGQAGWTL